MDVRKCRENTQNSLSELEKSPPPSFSSQLQNKAFNRKIGILTRIKNKIFGALTKNLTTKESSSSIRKIANIEQEPSDEVSFLDYIDDSDYFKNHSELSIKSSRKKSLITDSNIKKKLINLLKIKGFSASQAASVIKKKFKNCQSVIDLQQVYDYLPEKEVFDKGYDRMDILYKDFEDKLQFLVNLGYDEEKSSDAILEAFRQCNNKQEFESYIASIPECKYYEKGYTCNKEIQNTQKAAIKKMLKLGYPSREAEIEVYDKFRNYSKDEFHRVIADTPHFKISQKGYKNMTDYNSLRYLCIEKLKEKGYSNKKAIATVTNQQKLLSRNDFLRKINYIIKLKR